MSVVKNFEKFKRFNFGQLQIDASHVDDEKPAAAAGSTATPTASASNGDEAKQIEDSAKVGTPESVIKTGGELASGQ